MAILLPLNTYILLASPGLPVARFHLAYVLLQPPTFTWLFPFRRHQALFALLF
jgi:hypothetical protein